MARLTYLHVYLHMVVSDYALKLCVTFLLEELLGGLAPRILLFDLYFLMI